MSVAVGRKLEATKLAIYLWSSLPALPPRYPAIKLELNGGQIHPVSSSQLYELSETEGPEETSASNKHALLYHVDAFENDDYECEDVPTELAYSEERIGELHLMREGPILSMSSSQSAET